MRVATWNVNSIRTRVGRVVEFMQREQVDVLAMQEIKCKPEQFPLDAFTDAGYEVVIHGTNQYNGVAIASRVGLEPLGESFPGQPSFGKPGVDPVVEARAVGARCAGVDVWSVYVPNGRGLEDPHYAYKREFLVALGAAARSWAQRPTVITGDFNVAPLSSDIWSETDAGAPTHVTPESRAAFAELAAAGFEELSRRFIPAEHTYTFWDYQQLRFPRNEGMRIDFMFASPVLAPRATTAQIMREERKGTAPSDHVPVVVDFSAVDDTPSGELHE